MLAETMSLPPIHEYSRRLGVPGLALESSRVPFVAAAISVLLTCRQARLSIECSLTAIPYFAAFQGCGRPLLHTWLLQKHCHCFEPLHSAKLLHLQALQAT